MENNARVSTESPSVVYAHSRYFDPKYVHCTYPSGVGTRRGPGILSLLEMGIHTLVGLSVNLLLLVT